MKEVVRELFTNGYPYFLLYAGLAAAMILEALYDNERLSRVLGRVGMGALALFIGLRWETGTDWLAYFRIFYTPDTSSDYDGVVFGIDQGYLWFNQIVFRISSDYSTFLLIDAFLALAGVYYFIENSTRLRAMAVYLFYTSYAITHFMGSNRRMIAVGLVCVAFLKLSRSKSLAQDWSRWIAPFAAAAMFHRTSVMALPALVVNRRAWPGGVVAAGLSLCVVLGMSGAPFAILQWFGEMLSQYAHIAVIDKLVFYTSGGESQSAADFDVMGQALLGVVKRSTVLAIFVVYMRQKDVSEYAQRLFNIYVAGCAIYFLMIGSPVFQVTSTYYSIVEIVLLPIVFSSVPQHKVPYILYLLVSPLLLLLSALSPYLELYVPYRSIFTTY